MILRITQKGRSTLKAWDEKDTIFPNTIHLLSRLRDGANHSSFYFEKFKYENPPLHRCIAYLKKEELIKTDFS